MYDATEPEAAPPQPPPCAICQRPAMDTLLGRPVCGGCYASWCDEAPRGCELELAHAEKHPEDVAASGQNQWVNQDRWVVLKPGVSERLLRDFLTGWFARQKARAT